MKYDNVSIENGRVVTEGGDMLIINLYGFDPYTSDTPNSVSFRIGVLGNEYVFTRS